MRGEDKREGGAGLAGAEGVPKAGLQQEACPQR